MPCDGVKTEQGGSGSESSSSDGAAVRDASYDMGRMGFSLTLTSDGISVPQHVEILPEERECLEALCRKL